MRTFINSCIGSSIVVLVLTFTYELSKLYMISPIHHDFIILYMNSPIFTWTHQFIYDLTNLNMNSPIYTWSHQFLHELANLYMISPI